MDDAACIAIAALHAKDIVFCRWQSEMDGSPHAWGCWDDHPDSADTGQMHPWWSCSGPTKAAAARKYCERHNLLR